MKNICIFGILALSLVAQIGCNPQDDYPQITGKFTLNKSKVHFQDAGNSSLKGDVTKLVDTINITDRMIHDPNNFRHILQFDAVASNSHQVGGQFALELRDLTSLGYAYPNILPPGNVIYTDHSDEVLAFCYSHYYLSIYFNPSKTSPDLLSYQKLYLDYSINYDTNGKPLLDASGQPLKQQLSEDEIAKKSPVNQTLVDDFMKQVNDNDGISIPMTIYSTYDNDFSGCDPQISFPIMRYVPGSMSMEYNAKKSDLQLSSTPLVTTPNYNPYTYGDPNRYHVPLDVFASAFNYDPKASSNSSAPSSSSASFTGQDKLSLAAKQKAANLESRKALGEEAYKQILRATAYNACRKDSCPQVVIQQGSGSDLAFYIVTLKRTSRNALKTVSIEKSDLNQKRLVGVTTDSQFETNDLKAIGIVDNGSDDLGGNLAVDYKSGQGLILNAVEAVATKISN